MTTSKRAKLRLTFTNFWHFPMKFPNECILIREHQLRERTDSVWCGAGSCCFISIFVLERLRSCSLGRLLIRKHRVSSSTAVDDKSKNSKSRACVPKARRPVLVMRVHKLRHKLEMPFFPCAKLISFSSVMGPDQPGLRMTTLLQRLLSLTNFLHFGQVLLTWARSTAVRCENDFAHTVSESRPISGGSEKKLKRGTRWDEKRRKEGGEEVERN